MAEGSSLLKNGNKVLIDNQPYLILENEFVNPGKGQAFTRIKIKNLLNSKVLEKTVKIGESKCQILKLALIKKALSMILLLRLPH